MRHLAHVLLGFVLAACPGPDEDVPCTEDADCDLSPGGVCTLASTGNRWCSYPDPECPSGHRFSDQNVGDDLGGTCTDGVQHALTVSVGGNGEGSIMADVDGLTCSAGTCSGRFREGTLVELTAIPTNGQFLGWDGSCTGQGTCLVMMDRDRTAGALFGVAGEALWVRQVGTAGVDNGLGITVDSADSVVVVGQFSGMVTLGTETLTSAGGKDIFVAKLASDTGEIVWAKRYGGAMDDWGQAVATDSANNIYVTGLMRGAVDFGGGMLTAQGSDAFVLKLAPTGAYDWARQIGGSGYEQGFSLVADDTNVTVAGSHAGSMTVDMITVSAGGSPGSLNAFALALSASDGAAVWLETLGGTDFDFGGGIARDSSGNVVVAGTFVGSADFGGGVLNAAGGSTDTDVFLVKLAGADGAHLFSKRIGSTGLESISAISTDVSNNIVVTGNFRAALDFGCASPLMPTTTEEMYLVKYSQAGACTWAKNFTANAADVMVNAAGDISATGSYSGSISFGGSMLSSAGSNDVFAVRFNGAGDHLNSVRAGGTADERGAAIAQAADGRFFVTGGFSGFAEFGGEALTSLGDDDAFVLGLSPL